MAAQKDTPMAEAGDSKDNAKTQKNVKKHKKKGDDEKQELSEEDLELKTNLEMMVERISDGNPEIQKAALENISRFDYFPNNAL